MRKFHGVIVAMNSCYDDQGKISTDAVRKLTRFLIEKGVNGLYVGGSTGEGLIQNIEERKQVLESVIAENQGQVATIAHIGAITTADSVELAKHAGQAGADAISAVPPFYYQHSEQAVLQHWTAIMDSTELPFILYHIPSTTGFRLSPALFQKMLEHPRMAGVKITTPSSYELQQLRAMGGPELLVFNGPDEQFLAGRIMGASAGIGGTYGIMPELFLKIEACYVQGKISEAQRIQFMVNEIIADLLQLPVYAALKAIMRMRGVDCGEVRAPLETLEASHNEQVQAIYRKIIGAIETC